MVLIRSMICVVSPCSSAEVHRKRLSLLLVSCWFLAWLTLHPWRWRQHISPKHQWTYTLHGITTQTTILFFTYSLTQPSRHAQHNSSLHIYLLSVSVCWQGDVADEETCGNNREWFLLSILHLLLTLSDYGAKFLCGCTSPMRMERVKCKMIFILILNGK
jgi:hypothetical protein